MNLWYKAGGNRVFLPGGKYCSFQILFRISNRSIENELASSFMVLNT